MIPRKTPRPTRLTVFLIIQDWLLVLMPWTFTAGARPPVDPQGRYGEDLLCFRMQGQYGLDLLSLFHDQVCRIISEAANRSERCWYNESVR